MKWWLGFQADVLGEVKVLVTIEDLEQARRVLADTRKSNTDDVDWSQVDVGEPLPRSNPSHRYYHHSGRADIGDLVANVRILEPLGCVCGAGTNRM